MRKEHIFILYAVFFVSYTSWTTNYVGLFIYNVCVCVVCDVWCASVS